MRAKTFVIGGLVVLIVAAGACFLIDRFQANEIGSLMQNAADSAVLLLSKDVDADEPTRDRMAAKYVGAMLDTSVPGDIDVMQKLEKQPDGRRALKLIVVGHVTTSVRDVLSLPPADVVASSTAVMQ